MPRDRVPELKENLLALAWESGKETAQVDALLARFTADPGPPPFAARRAMIDRWAGAPAARIA